MPHRAVRDNFKGRFDGVCHNLGLKVCKLNELIDLPSDKKENKKEQESNHKYKDKALDLMAGFKFRKDSANAYKLAFERFKKSVEVQGDCEIFEIKASTRVLLGTGNASVFEFGFNLNYPWGVPYISGSTLKGALSAYLARRGGEDWKRYKGAEKSRAQVDLFGGSLQGDSKSYVGLVTFHDAWMSPWEPRRDKGDWFDIDMITPHYASYYKGESAPSGMDDPIPIKIAALCPGLRFQVVLQGPKEYRPLVKEWLLEALKDEGIGGKTAVGYGRFEYVPKAEEVKAMIQEADSDQRLKDLYKEYGDNDIYFSVFSEKLGTKMSDDLQDMWKVLRPLDYLASLIGDTNDNSNNKNKISKLKDLNKRYKSMDDNISRWEKCMGIPARKESTAGEELFRKMQKKGFLNDKSSKNTKIVSELKTEWYERSYSADELCKKINSNEEIRTSGDALLKYINENYTGEDLELLLMELSEM